MRNKKQVAAKPEDKEEKEEKTAGLLRGVVDWLRDKIHRTKIKKDKDVPIIGVKPELEPKVEKPEAPTKIAGRVIPRALRDMTITGAGINAGVLGTGIGAGVGALRNKGPNETRLKAILMDMLAGATSGVGAVAGMGMGSSLARTLAPRAKNMGTIGGLGGMAAGGTAGSRLISKKETPMKTAGSVLDRLMKSTASTSAIGAGVGGVAGQLRNKSENESRLHSILRSALTGAVTGAGVGVGGMIGSGMGKGVGEALGMGNDSKATATGIGGLLGSTVGGLAAHNMSKRGPEKTGAEKRAGAIGRIARGILNKLRGRTFHTGAKEYIPKGLSEELGKDFGQAQSSKLEELMKHVSQSKTLEGGFKGPSNKTSALRQIIKLSMIKAACEDKLAELGASGGTEQIKAPTSPSGSSDPRVQEITKLVKAKRKPAAKHPPKAPPVVPGRTGASSC
jgi:hypothetical protein